MNLATHFCPLDVSLSASPTWQSEHTSPHASTDNLLRDTYDIMPQKAKCRVDALATKKAIRFRRKVIIIGETHGAKAQKKWQFYEDQARLGKIVCFLENVMDYDHPDGLETEMARSATTVVSGLSNLRDQMAHPDDKKSSGCRRWLMDVLSHERTRTCWQIVERPFGAAHVERFVRSFRLEPHIEKNLKTPEQLVLLEQTAARFDAWMQLEPTLDIAKLYASKLWRPVSNLPYEFYIVGDALARTSNALAARETRTDSYMGAPFPAGVAEAFLDDPTNLVKSVRWTRESVAFRDEVFARRIVARHHALAYNPIDFAIRVGHAHVKDLRWCLLHQQPDLDVRIKYLGKARRAHAVVLENACPGLALLHGRGRPSTKL